MAGRLGNYRDAGKRRADGDKFRRRHRKTFLALVTLGVVVSLGITITGAYAYMLNKQLGNVDKVKVSDKLKEGDVVKVKVLEVDKQGRIRLSMKAVEEGEGAPAA